MKDTRKAHLVKPAFESDLTKELKTDCKDIICRQFITSNLRLQSYFS